MLTERMNCEDQLTSQLDAKQKELDDLNEKFKALQVLSGILRESKILRTQLCINNCDV
jgi:hypothetical protein